MISPLENLFGLTNLDQDNFYTSHNTATSVIINNKNSRYKKSTITPDLEEIQC